MLKVVWLVLMVHNADTGELLFKHEEQMQGFSVSGDRIEDCRTLGIKLAHDLTRYFRGKGYSNAFTNLDCEWRYGTPGNPT